MDVTLRTLREGDLDAYLALREHSFGYPAGDDVLSELRGRMPATVGAFDPAGRLVASAARPLFETFVAGRRQPLLGIAAVQTLLPARRRGVARTLLARLLSDGREEGIGWSLLYPFDPRFYDRLGWQSLPTGVRLAMDMAWLERPRPVDAWPVTSDLRNALHETYQRCAAQWNFSNARTMGPWDVWSDMLPERGGRGAAYRVEDGYAVLRLRDGGGSGTTLDVIDAAWCSPGGRDEVLALLAAYAGQADRLEIEVPHDDALAWSLADWFTTPTRATRMVRVVDLAAALAPLVPIDDTRACTVRVRDALAPWNEGTWRITPGPERCAVASTSSTAEAVLDVRAVALLVGGAATPAAVLRAGLADGDRRALVTLASLAAGRTPFQSLNDRF